MAIKNDLALQFFSVLLDVIVLHHDNIHIHFIEKLVEVNYLVLYNFLVCKERGHKSSMDEQGDVPEYRASDSVGLSRISSTSPCKSIHRNQHNNYR